MAGITRREVLGGALGGAAAVAGTTWLSSLMSQAWAAPGNQKLNFVFFLADDQGWMDLSCYGSKFYESPNIDCLAREGMRFTDAYAACPICSPTRASILTGKYPARLRVTDWLPGYTYNDKKLLCPRSTQQLPLQEVTIAEALKGAGYVSAHIGKWHLGANQFWPEHQGFDVNVGGTHAGAPNTYFAPYRIPNLTEGPAGEYLTDRLTDEAEKFIEANKQKPFFLSFWHYAVHRPTQAKPETIQHFARKPKSGGQTNPTYAGMILSMDESMGRVLKKLDELKLTDRTVIIYMSDNGGLPPDTSNAPLRNGKGTPWEGGIREPMIVKWPGVVKPGSVCDVPVTSVDFFPTMLEMAGVRVSPAWNVDGESFVSLLKGGNKPIHEAIYWHYPHYHRWQPFGAIRKGDMKLIQAYEDNKLQLYNLKTDIGEQDNLADKMPQEAAKLQTDLMNWLRSVNADMPKPNPNWKPKNPGGGQGGKTGN